jgi:hypothetical protein
MDNYTDSKSGLAARGQFPDLGIAHGVPHSHPAGLYKGDIQAAAGIKTVDPKIHSLLPFGNTFHRGIRSEGHSASRSTCTLTSTRAARGEKEKERWI